MSVSEEQGVGVQCGLDVARVVQFGSVRGERLLFVGESLAQLGASEVGNADLLRGVIQDPFLELGLPCGILLIGKVVVVLSMTVSANVYEVVVDWSCLLPRAVRVTGS